MSLINEAKIKEAWQARELSVDIWIDSPGQIWADFRHDVDELFILLEDEITLEMHGQIMHPTLGQEILIPANTLHTVKNIGSTKSRWLYGYKQKH